jgi:glutamyl-tRNA reductase
MLQSLAKRQIGPKLIIDMAVPRDFNTEGLPSDIRTFDISDLKKYLSKQSEKKAKDLPKAEKIIEDEVKVFSAWTEFSGSDLLKPYAEKFEITRLQILDEFRSQFSSKDLELVDKLSRRMLHRLQATFANVLKKKNQDDM